MVAVLLVVLTALSLLVVLSPLRRPLPDADAVDGARENLEEDYRASLDALRELDAALGRGEVDPPAAARERARLQGRAARTLAALDSLPPAPPPRRGAPVLPAVLGLGAIAALVAVGAHTFLPAWQLSGLGAAEASVLRSAVRLPELRARAQRDGQVAAYRAWAEAAFDASRYQEAALGYTHVLRSEPRDPQALRRVGIFLLQGEEKAAEGVAFVRMSAQLDPENAEGQLFLGFALARVGMNEEALRALERYRVLNPQGRDADDLIGSLRARAGQESPALELYGALGCARCHGVEGRGGVGPSLRAGRMDREAMAQVIRRGAPSMPGYDEQQLSREQLDALLDLLHGWQGAP